MTTFKQFLKDKYHDRAESGNLEDPYNLIVWDILNDLTFPNKETAPDIIDGLMLLDYVMCRQPYYEDMEMNCQIIDAYKYYWRLYRKHLHQTGELVSPYMV